MSEQEDMVEIEKEENSLSENELQRISISSVKWMDKINEERKKLRLKKLSYRKITELQVKHKNRDKVAQDIINYRRYDYDE